MRDAASATVRRLRQAMDERERRTAPVRPALVVGRNEDGTARLLRLDGECIYRGGIGGYKGQVVNQLPGLMQRQGTLGIPIVSRRDAAALIWVERLEPSFLQRGSSSLAVTVIGRGFRPVTQFDFLIPGTEEINPGITVLATSYVSKTEVTLLLNVSPTADLLPDGSAPLAFGDPGGRF